MTVDEEDEFLVDLGIESMIALAHGETLQEKLENGIVVYQKALHRLRIENPDYSKCFDQIREWPDV